MVFYNVHVRFVMIKCSTKQEFKLVKSVLRTVSSLSTTSIDKGSLVKHDAKYYDRHIVGCWNVSSK